MVIIGDDAENMITIVRMIMMMMMTLMVMMNLVMIMNMIVIMMMSMMMMIVSTWPQVSAMSPSREIAAHRTLPLCSLVSGQWSSK